MNGRVELMTRAVWVPDQTRTGRSWPIRPRLVSRRWRLCRFSAADSATRPTISSPYPSCPLHLAELFVINRNRRTPSYPRIWAPTP
jgi:hypothetical protein